MDKAIDWLRYRLVAVDMDGTLAGADHRVTARTAAVLGRAERAGLRVVIVTGRAYPTALAVWNRAGLSAPLVTCGGALTLQPPGMAILRSTVLPEAVVRESLRLGRELALTVSLWTEAGIWVTRPGVEAELLSAVNQMPVLVMTPGPDAPVPFGPMPVLKVMLGAKDPDRLDRVAGEAIARLAPAIAARSMPQFVEATAPDASKREALEAVLAALGVDPAETIAIGDGENDVGMLTLAGLAAVPANAMPGPRRVAHRVIGHHDREGVADFLDEVLRYRAAERQG
jgi:Cof subfamily protein (haloacid dehalogenase superfamily)